MKKETRTGSAFQQLAFMGYELTLMVNRKWWRWLSIWFGGGVGPLARYRVERALFLMFGDAYPVLRPVFLPFLFALRLFGGPTDIHYRAAIGPGLKILHPHLGIVISAHAICGEHLTLTGGNCIGGRPAAKMPGDITIGNDVLVGANAIILGPIRLGDKVTIGAGAVVVNDVETGQTVVGVRATALRATADS